jgi:hypothetical protein
MDRFAYHNLVQAVEGIVLTPSGAQAGFPIRNVRDPVPSVEWRTPVGHTIGPDNDRLDFERSSLTYAAVLTHGTYETPAAVAAHVAARMTAEDANNYAVTPVGPRFTIAGDAAFDLLLDSGANKGRSFGPDLGHLDTADKTGLDSYVGDSDAYHSRAWLRVDLLEAQAFARALIHGHNLSSGAAVTLEANDTDAWTSPAFSQALAAAGVYRIADFTEETRRYLRLVLDDRENADSFTRLGVLFVGPYTEFSVSHSFSERHAITGPSHGLRAEQGALYQARYQQMRAWSVLFRGLTDADKLAGEALADEVRVGGALFWTRFSADLADTHYCAYRDMAFERMERTANLWTLGLDLEEVLG